MGRRVLAFFLGMLFGIILVVGTVYIVVCVVSVNKYLPDTQKYIGELSDKSAYDMVKEIYDLYSKQAGVKDENGNYYTVKQFCDKYKIDLNAALGMELPQEALDVPAFELFTKGGIERAMGQIKVSAVPAIVNMLGKSENGMFKDDMIAELSKYTMADLLSKDVGIAGVFANIKLSDVAPGAFPAEDSDNKLMWAVGQITVGGALKSSSGSESMLLQLKEGNAFEAVGALEVSALLGENKYINAILGAGAKVRDLIGEDGGMKLDEMLGKISVGELLGCQKNLITNPDEYDGIVKLDSDGDAYEAVLNCHDDTEGHVHNDDCYEYAWYSTGECSNTATDHKHEASDDLVKDGKYYPRVTGLYAVLSSLTVGDLTNGNDNALIDRIKELKVSDIIDKNQVSGVMSALVDLTIADLMNGAIDKLYLGDFFEFTRKLADKADYDQSTVVDLGKFSVIASADGKLALSVNGVEWYEGLLDCASSEEGHEHTSDCYRYVWIDKIGNAADGIQAKIAGKQIADLQSLNDEVQKLTLDDVFGENIPKMLSSIRHARICDLNYEIKNIYVGSLMEFRQQFTCGNDEPDHKHVTGECPYVWLDKNDQPASGLMGKLADKQVRDIDDFETIIKNEFTLGDVFGDNPPKMLKSLLNTKIGDLNNAIDSVYLGDFLEYEREITCGQEDDETHSHTYLCFAWTDKNGKSVTGMMAKLASKKVSEMSSLNESVLNEFTLKDVFGEGNVPSMLKDIENTTIGNLESEINKLYVGSTMGYHRNVIEDITGYGSCETPLSGESFAIVRQKQISGSPAKYIKTEDDGDDKTWYEAYFDCSLNHDHGVDCYKYNWYDKDNQPISGMIKAFANSKLDNIDDTLDDLTIKKLGIDADGNTVLKAIENEKLNNIGSAINNMKMGTLLGYTQGEKLATISTCDKTHEHTDLCYDYNWYADKAKTTLVKGLNGKIANMTVEGISGGQGVGSIAKTLTIGDLIDSGMMEVKPDDEYKFAIIFCSHDDHCDCSLTKYLTACALNNSVTAKTYWDDAHSSYSGDKSEHKDAWKQSTLLQFMNYLLDAMH